MTRKLFPKGTVVIFLGDSSYGVKELSQYYDLSKILVRDGTEEMM